MNYKSQLKAWAIDRAIRQVETGNVEKHEDIFALADKLADYSYIPREDLESTAKELFELVRNAPANESSIDALIGTLEHIKQDRVSQGIDKDVTH